MEKSNIIISIIIVLCIAAAVAAYGITNGDSPIFSNLTSMGSNDNGGNGVGNHTITANTTNPTSGGSSDGGSNNGGSGSGSSGSGANGGSSSNGGSNSGGGGSGNGGSGSNVVPASTIQNDAAQYIGEPGCYAGTPYQSGDYWIVPIYDSNGTQVDSIGYTLSGQYMGRM